MLINLIKTDNIKSKLITSILATAFIAILAQISFHIPISPIPITLQVFGFILIGLLLDEKLATYSLIQYAILGIIGLPIFADGKCGMAALMSPSLGYIIGFIPAVFVISKTFRTLNKSFKSAIIAGIFGIAVLYSFGAGWLSVWSMVFNKELAFSAYIAGVIPFIGVDLLKLLIAATLIAKIKK